MQRADRSGVQVCHMPESRIDRERCIAKAAHCRELARSSCRFRTQEELLVIAQQYEALAEVIDTLADSRPRYP
jgi:hypothetical protein